MTPLTTAAKLTELSANVTKSLAQGKPLHDRDAATLLHLVCALVGVSCPDDYDDVIAEMAEEQAAIDAREADDWRQERQVIAASQVMQ